MSRKKTKHKSTNNTYKYLIYTLSALILILAGFLGGYYTGINTKKPPQKIVKTDDSIQKLAKIVKEETESYKSTNQTSVKSTESLDYLNAVKNTKKVSPKKNEPIKKESTKAPAKKVILVDKKPKLVIIMDDMSFGYEVKNIKKLHINITPSFFPPTKYHPNTPKYAKEFNSYMVHLPLQAISFPHEEPKTLHVGDSYSKVENRVDNIHKIFPNAHFFNNHTGSLYTSSLPDMKKLISVLDSDNINFLDSRTTPHIVSPEIYKSLHKHLFMRNVFLDNKQNIPYIENQLKEGVRIAKKDGFAIVICHPHKATFQALADSKNTILKSVDVITIDKLNELYKNNQLSKL